MILSFDTTRVDQIEVFLLDEADESIIASVVHDLQSGGRAQIILTEIDQLLRQQQLTLASITSVRVAVGPGSFTGSRVGVTVANSLGLALSVPVNDLPVGSFVKPLYGQPANISATKS